MKRVEFLSHDGHWCFSNFYASDWEKIKKGGWGVCINRYRIVDTETGIVEREWHPDTGLEVIGVPAPAPAIETIEQAYARGWNDAVAACPKART